MLHIISILPVFRPPSNFDLKVQICVKFKFPMEIPKWVTFTLQTQGSHLMVTYMMVDKASPMSSERMLATLYFSQKCVDIS